MPAWAPFSVVEEGKEVSGRGWYEPSNGPRDRRGHLTPERGLHHQAHEVLVLASVWPVTGAPTIVGWVPLVRSSPELPLAEGTRRPGHP